MVSRQVEPIRMSDSNESGQPNNQKLLVGIAAFAVMALLVALSLNTGTPQQKAAAPNSSNGIASELASEVCMALGNTPKFDSGQRRAIMKDYGFDLASIARVENCIGYLFNDVLPNPDRCRTHISEIMKGRASHRAEIYDRACAANRN
jgi:hypothetical protein